jgi:hypothetical protein
MKMNNFLIIGSGYKREWQVIKIIGICSTLQGQVMHKPTIVLLSHRINITYPLIIQNHLSKLQVGLIHVYAGHQGRGKRKAFHFKTYAASPMGFGIAAIYHRAYAGGGLLPYCRGTVSES